MAGLRLELTGYKEEQAAARESAQRAALELEWRLEDAEHRAQVRHMELWGIGLSCKTLFFLSRLRTSPNGHVP